MNLAKRKSSPRKRISTLEQSPFDTRTSKEVREDIRRAGREDQADKPKNKTIPQKKAGSNAPTVEVHPGKKTDGEMDQNPHSVLDPEAQTNPIIVDAKVGTAS